MATIGNGDVLLVTRLDRLARSTRDLPNVLGTLADKGGGFRSLRDTWADTTTAHGRLMVTILEGLAEFERELILARTGEDAKGQRNAESVLVASPSLRSINVGKPSGGAKLANPLPKSRGRTTFTTRPSAGCASGRVT